MNRLVFVVLGVLGCFLLLGSCGGAQLAISDVGMGWSQNSVNTVIFRNQALCSFKDRQFVAFYNGQGQLVLGSRKLGADQWNLEVSPYYGNVQDAHNSISIAVDALGYLHVSWDQHDTPLRYAKSKEPFGLELGEPMSMTGLLEDKVTYPEFQNLDDSLLFLYRSGASGRGNMVVNRYDPSTGNWTQLHNNLIDGQQKRSAYWQTHVDSFGAIHLSWVWRETWDVSTNHDIAYAVSKDGGYSWEDIDGNRLAVPITESSASYAWRVPQGSNLINQTSMTTDAFGNPFIASYWRLDSITQYKVVYHKDGMWQLLDTGFRDQDFSLGGGGTKSIPISRPELLVDHGSLYLLFRDVDRGNKITLGSYLFLSEHWKVDDLTDFSVGQWEPNFDKSLWKQQKKLHIFSQKVSQLDGEGVDVAMAPQAVQVLEVKLIN